MMEDGATQRDLWHDQVAEERPRTADGSPTRSSLPRPTRPEMEMGRSRRAQTGGSDGDIITLT